MDDWQLYGPVQERDVSVVVVLLPDDHLLKLVSAVVKGARGLVDEVAVDVLQEVKKRVWIK